MTVSSPSPVFRGGALVIRGRRVNDSLPAIAFPYTLCMENHAALSHRQGHRRLPQRAVQGRDRAVRALRLRGRHQARARRGAGLQPQDALPLLQGQGRYPGHRARPGLRQVGRCPGSRVQGAGLGARPSEQRGLSHFRAQDPACLPHHVRPRCVDRRQASRARSAGRAGGALHHARRRRDGQGGRDRHRPGHVRMVDVGCDPRHCHAAPVGHAGARTGLQEALGLPGHDHGEGSERKETMTAGVTAGDRFRSWADIQANAARGAGGLRALSVGEDDSVALMLRNDFATFEVNMAAGQLGAYAVPINWHFTPEEAGYILADCAAKVLVAHSDLLAQIASGIPLGVKVLVVPTPAEIAAAYSVPTEKSGAPEGVQTWDAFVARTTPNTQPPRASRGSMIYTSGTTGRPKGVRRQPSSPEMQALMAQEVGRYWGLLADPSIVVLMNGPMYHSAPPAYGIGSARLGLPVVLQPRFDAADMLRLIEKHRVSHMHIVPTMLVRLLRLPDEVKRRHDLSSP